MGPACSSWTPSAKQPVVVQGAGIAPRLIAFLVGPDEGRPSIIALKQHCADHLLRSMVIDKAQWLPELPRTRKGKIDRLTLKQRAS